MALEKMKGVPFCMHENAEPLYNQVLQTVIHKGYTADMRLA